MNYKTETFLKWDVSQDIAKVYVLSELWHNIKFIQERFLIVLTFKHHSNSSFSDEITVSTIFKVETILWFPTLIDVNKK